MKSPVKKKNKQPVKVKAKATVGTEPETTDRPVEGFVIHKRKHLLDLLNNAPEEALIELYLQVMGANWKHRVAELGDTIRVIRHKRKRESHGKVSTTGNT